MAVVDITTLKSYFETGDKPTEAQFIDLIDTLFDQATSNHSELTLDDGTNPHATTASDLGLATVATTGSYNNLSDTPTIPTAFTESFIFAASDETSDLATGTSVLTWRVPYGFTVTDVRANVNEAPTGSILDVDIKVNGVTLFTDRLTIDATEKTSVTAATSWSINPAFALGQTFSSDDEITVDIVAIGSTTAGKGLKLTIIGNQ